MYALFRKNMEFNYMLEQWVSVINRIKYMSIFTLPLPIEKLWKVLKITKKKKKTVSYSSLKIFVQESKPTKILREKDSVLFSRKMTQRVYTTDKDFIPSLSYVCSTSISSFMSDDVLKGLRTRHLLIRVFSR